MTALINSHTHVFNIKCAPERFLGFPAVKALSNYTISFYLIKLLRGVISSEKDFIEKYANFLAIGKEKSQELVFEKLKSYYSEGTRFVALTIDMDFMGAGEAVLNYPTQLSQVIDIKKKYPDTFFPFLSVDPRRGDAKRLLSFVRDNIEKNGFSGVKMYPPLGFFPFDPALNEVYKYLQDTQTPIITHCTKGGIYLRNKNYTSAQLQPANLNPSPLKEYNYTGSRNMKNGKFKNYFTDPDNYLEVLAVYPDLKLCFAHYGGSDEIIAFKKGEKNTWYEKIKIMLSNERYKNLYTDVSYTLAEKKIFDMLRNDIQNPQLRNKIMFATDFFMTIMENNEDVLVNNFRNALSAEDFEHIALHNPIRFLKL